MKKLTRLFCLLAMVTMLVGTMTVTASAEASAIDLSETVEIIMYVVGTEPIRFPEVMEVYNKMLMEDLNATLTVKWLSWGDYLTKYPLVLASGETIDLIYAANWIDFYQHAANGAFLPLEELLPVYCAESLKAYPESAFQQTSVGGHVYGYGSNFSTYNAFGATLRGDLMEQYGIQSIDTLEDYGNYLKTVAKENPEMDPMLIVGTKGNQLDDVFMYNEGLYPLTGNSGSFYWIDPEDPEGKVFARTDWSGMDDFLATMKDWSDSGCWSKAALSNKDKSLFTNGKAASRLSNFDQYVGDYIKNPQWNVQYKNFAKNTEVLSYTQDTMAVPISAKHPERALMMLDKLLTDTRYYNLLAYGIEGETYRFTDDGLVEALDPENFALESGTSGFRTLSNNHYKVGSPATLQDDLASMAASVKENKYRSFVMDTSAVKHEYAAVQNILSQYYNPLKLGYTEDIGADLDNLKQQLQLAGSDKIVEELQRQVDAFNQSNP